MKANEFIKMQGLVEARRVLHDARGCVGVKLWGRYEFSTEDLKRLVESHELVEKHGGLISAIKYIKFLQSSVDIGLYHSLDDIDYKTEIPLIEQAIADVESCMEVSSESN